MLPYRSDDKQCRRTCGGSGGNILAVLAVIYWLAAIVGSGNPWFAAYVFSDSEVALETVLGRSRSSAFPKLTEMSFALQDGCLRDLSIEARHVKGHSEDPFNEVADRAAEHFMKAHLSTW